MRTSFFLNLKYLCNLLFALSWLLAFLYSEETSSWKDNLSSILIPSSFKDFFEVTWLPSMLRVYWLHISEFHCGIIIPVRYSQYIWKKFPMKFRGIFRNNVPGILNIGIFQAVPWISYECYTPFFGGSRNTIVVFSIG